MINSDGNSTTTIPAPDPDDWDSIRSWRNSTRELLIRARIGIGKDRRVSGMRFIHSSVREILSDVTPGVVGFYWPIKGEFDLRNLAADLLDLGWKAALPVVAEKGMPLEFSRWHPEMKLVPGVWNIPVPPERHSVTPSVLLIPLVGYDEKKFRLGYGGGYYDRTLAEFEKRPLTIGIGLDSGRLKTIYPQWHDIVMDRIVAARA